MKQREEIMVFVLDKNTSDISEKVGVLKDFSNYVFFVGISGEISMRFYAVF